MALRTTCPPCQIGDHKRHYRVVQHPPEGGVGGAICDCEGDCLDNKLEDFLDPRTRAAIEMFRKMSKRG